MTLYPCLFILAYAGRNRRERIDTYMTNNTITDNTQAQNAAEQNSQPAPVNATPAETRGNQTEKPPRTFTQEEVNQIISDRLSRERAKQATVDPRVEERERNLEARENGLRCREFISENGSHYPKALLDILDTSNFDSFKETADKLLNAFPGIDQNAPKMFFSGPTPGGVQQDSDVIREAFRAK